MRICDLTTLYIDGGEGGVNTYLLEKARHLSSQEQVASHTIIVPGEQDQQRALFGSTLHTVKSPSLPSNPDHRVISRLGHVRRILEEVRPDVVEVDSAYFLGKVASRLRKQSGAAIIGFYHVHLPTFIARPGAARFGPLISGLTERLAWAYVRYCNRHLDRLIVTSQDMRDRLAVKGFSGLECVPLGVNLELFRPPLNGTATRRTGYELLYVGRLSREKDLDVLLQAHLLLAQRGDYRLRIVGDGPLRERLEKRVNGNDRVTFTGVCPYGPKLAQHYETADLVVQPSPHETFGLILLEAWASGLPVVAARQGGPADLVTPELGALARPGDAADFADQIEAVMARPERYRGCRGHVEQHFSWERCFSRLLEVYERALAERRRDRTPEAIAPVLRSAP